MRILLKGYYGFGNLGDDILMIVSYKLLRKAYPEVKNTLFTNNSAKSKYLKGSIGLIPLIKKLLN